MTLVHEDPPRLDDEQRVGRISADVAHQIRQQPLEHDVRHHEHATAVHLRNHLQMQTYPRLQDAPHIPTESANPQADMAPEPVVKMLKAPRQICVARQGRARSSIGILSEETHEIHVDGQRRHARSGVLPRVVSVRFRLQRVQQRLSRAQCRSDTRVLHAWPKRIELSLVRAHHQLRSRRRHGSDAADAHPKHEDAVHFCR
mmetsp:Transcript_18201/g.69003  ORF Transcript_18201/g.69003 Transcript_18201/m.69003 type:complete len:201 (-) Transcript_18201:156-758(-)|eukprot:scaffold556_cov221-Pinguiococcus_pyrenoidosus.AAC.13